MIGKHSAFHGLCNRVFILDRDQIDESRYDEVISPGWWENYSPSPGSPQTKVCNYLREECRIEPQEWLLRYSIQVSDEAHAAARNYLDGIRDRDQRVVLIHYEGNTAPENKNLTHDLVRSLCTLLLSLDCVPVILDWDRRSPIPDSQTVFCPDSHHPLWGDTGTGDAEIIAALACQSELMIGIDSGPLHVVGATMTPAIGVWTFHHPVQFFDLCPNVTHLVPDNWETIPPATKPETAAYFRERYAFREYDRREGVYKGIERELRKMIQERLGSPVAVIPKPEPEKFFVAIPTLNRYDLLSGCIDSVFQGSAVPDAIYVIDNGGQWTGHLSPLVRVIRPPRNLGVAGSWNLAARLCHPYPLILLNDDIEIGEKTLERLLSHSADIPFADMATGFTAFLWRPEIRKRLGDFDDRFWPAYFEDNDYAWRAKLAGVTISAPEDAGLRKKLVSQTIAAMNDGERAEFRAAWRAAQAYYVEKWGGIPLSERYTRPFNSSRAH